MYLSIYIANYVLIIFLDLILTINNNFDLILSEGNPGDIYCENV